MSNDQNKDMFDFVQLTGDKIANLFEQLTKGNWVDDNGHDVKMNKAMLEMKDVIFSAMDLNKRYYNA